MTTKLMRHHIFSELRDGIMSCSLAPGSEMSENELARRFGVSKTPIRDALQKLEFEGLVEITARQGHRVTQISVSDAQDILELRKILEVGAVRKIAAEAGNRALSDLDRFRDADMSSLAEFARYNHTFHRHLCELSGNRRLLDAMRRLMDNYDRICVVSLSMRRTEAEAMVAALVDHNKLIDALQVRDGSAAARLAAKHIERSRTQVLRGLSNTAVVA